MNPLIIYREAKIISVSIDKPRFGHQDHDNWVNLKRLKSTFYWSRPILYFTGVSGAQGLQGKPGQQGDPGREGKIYTTLFENFILSWDISNVSETKYDEHSQFYSPISFFLVTCKMTCLNSI